MTGYAPIDPKDTHAFFEITDLARTNPIVAACFHAYRHNLLSWPQALSEMVVALAKDCKSKEELLLECALRATPIITKL